MSFDHHTLHLLIFALGSCLRFFYQLPLRVAVRRRTTLIMVINSAVLVLFPLARYASVCAIAAV